MQEDFNHRRDQQKEHIVHEEGRYFLSYEASHARKILARLRPYWLVEL